MVSSRSRRSQSQMQSGVSFRGFDSRRTLIKDQNIYIYIYIYLMLGDGRKDIPRSDKQEKTIQFLREIFDTWPDQSWI